MLGVRARGSPWASHHPSLVCVASRPAKQPHVVELLAAVDNKEEPEDLPLAPWC